jgi:thiopeptide-type bacteriocin biosynthesis protein
LDRLLIDAVYPLVTDLADSGLATEVFWLRYWDGGPHLRLRVRPTTSDLADRTRREIRSCCVDYLRRCPAPSDLTEAEYAATAASFAALEHAGPPLALQPHDSVRFLPYRREPHVYGCGASVDAVERHFVESSSLAMMVLRSHPTAAARNSLGFHLIATSWLMAHVGAGYGAIPQRFAVLARRHAADARRRYGAASADCRAAWQRCTTVVSEHTAGRPTKGVLGAWTRSLTRLRDALAATRAVDVPAIVDTAAHLACNRLGVPFPDELTLRFLAERSMNDATGDTMEVRT